MKLNIKTNYKTTELDKLIKIARDKYKVKVGVIGKQASVEVDGITVAQYGYYNEVGTIDGNIPQRSFIISPITQHLQENILLHKERYSEFLLVEKDIRKAYKLLGNDAKGIILNAFATSDDGKWKPNAETTIKIKGSTKPLIDKGRLRKSINFKVINND